MPTEANRAIGSLDYSDNERRDLARKSRSWCCETCGPIRTLLKQPDEKQEKEKISNDCNKQICGPSTSGENLKDGLEERNGTVGDKTESSKATGSSDINSKIVTGDSNQKTILENQRQQYDDDSTALVPRSSTKLKPTTQNHYNNSADEVLVKLRSRNETPRIPVDNNYISTPNSSLNGNDAGIDNLPDRRRFYPPLVFRSICILLSLLLLRRAVMVLQA